MTDRSGSQPGHYEIRLRGEIDEHWKAWFDGLTVRKGGDGTTTIAGPFTDQAALHGALQRLRDLGIPLISVIRTEPDPGQPSAPTDTRKETS